MTVKTAIPRVDHAVDKRIRGPFEAMREILEVITGRREDLPPLQELDPSIATTQDCANMINQILRRLQR